MEWFHMALQCLTDVSCQPCNSWVFCPQPHCWSADNGNTHLFGECWLKWQTDPMHPLYGQRGEYTERYRNINGAKHLSGAYPAESNPEWIGAQKAWATSPLASPTRSGRQSFGIAPGSRRNLTVRPTYPNSWQHPPTHTHPPSTDANRESCPARCAALGAPGRSPRFAHARRYRRTCRGWAA